MGILLELLGAAVMVLLVLRGLLGFASDWRVRRERHRAGKIGSRAK